MQKNKYIIPETKISSVKELQDYLESWKKRWIEGWKEGWREGYKEGRAEERLANVRSLKENGVPMEIIIKSLRLTAEELEQL